MAQGAVVARAQPAPPREVLRPALLGQQIVGMSPNRRQSLLAIDGSAGVLVVDTERLTIVHRTALPGPRPAQLALSDDGRWVAGAYLLAPRVVLVDAARGGPPRGLPLLDVEALAFSPDGRLLAAGTGDGIIVLWDVASGAERRRLTSPTPSNIVALRFTPDGQRLVVAAVVKPRGVGRRRVYDGALRIFEVPSGRLLRSLGEHTNAPEAIDISGDGQLLASADLDGQVLLWSLPAGRLRRRIAAAPGALTCLRLSPDGALLASGATDRQLRLWSTRSGKEVRVLAGAHAASALVFSASGRQLHALTAANVTRVTGGGMVGVMGNALRTFDVTSGAELRVLQRSSPTP